MFLTDKETLIAIARKASAKHDLPPELVCSIVEQESSWDPWALRYEPAFFNKYVMPAYAANNFDLTEAKARAISWGLMQVMGQVAREFAFVGEMPSLCDPEIGMEVGCRVFAHKFAAQEGVIEKALLSWNGGVNLNYPAQVIARMPAYENA